MTYTDRETPSHPLSSLTHSEMVRKKFVLTWNWLLSPNKLTFPVSSNSVRFPSIKLCKLKGSCRDLLLSKTMGGFSGMVPMETYFDKLYKITLILWAKLIIIYYTHLFYPNFKFCTPVELIYYNRSTTNLQIPWCLSQLECLLHIQKVVSLNLSCVKSNISK
jgi:hypothetical protein